jgi:hypothetical protein
LKRDPAKRRGGGSLIAIGMFFASILDPKTRLLTELIDRKQSRERTEPGKENA